MDCPACGSPITIEVGPEHPLSTSVSDAVITAKEDEHIEITRNCWDCGWHETRELIVASIDTAPGDEAVIERNALVDEITNELADIGCVKTLEEVLAAIRRQRRADPARSDSDDDTTE